MRKLCLLMALLTVLLCSCLQGEFQNSFLTTADVTTSEDSLPAEVSSEETTPEVSTPEVSTPEVSTPEVSTPEVSTPEVTAPEVTTPEATTPEVTAPEVTAPEVTTPEVTTSEVTTPEETTPEETTPEETQHEHVFGESVIVREPTCAIEGEAIATCSCGEIKKEPIYEFVPHRYWNEVSVKQAPTCVDMGYGIMICSVCGHTQDTTIPATGKHVYGEAVVTKEATCFENGEKIATCTTCTKTEKTVIFAVGKHVYENGICSGCGDAPVTLYPVPSVYDADGDGKNDVYNFSPKLLDTFQNGIHISAGDYLSESRTSTAFAQGLQHWYITENQNPAQFILYSVTVPETGEYEMVIHLRMKDAQERGTKYTVNAGTAYEYSFETSYGYDGLNYSVLRDINTLTTYMYGVKVNLVAGENIIKMEQSSNSPKCQHYRDFYFVKTGEFHLHSYQNETLTIKATCATDGEKVATCSCGKTKVTVIPATQHHIYENDICIGCGKVYVPVGIIEYDYLYETPGFAGGTITFLPETSDVYTFYWADANGKLKDYTMLYSDEFAADVEAEVTIQSFTAIPKGATRLLAVSGDGDVTYSYTIPESRLFTEEEMYAFGALSDTHQGTRYGSTSIPYNHFINAAKVLYDKGAITIGICGDFSYDNIESEYILHAEAIQEIYGYAPDMPIFTTSGNHESKYTGFSYDWYMEYTRGVVDYESDLTYTNFGKDNLDYVVELPDGSVMIFLHQIYYDYGSSSSRLLDDHQLDWLGERLEEYKDKTVFLFFHTFMDEQVGDATASGNEYGLPLISSTVEYKKFDEFFKKYTNVVYFSGHSHWAFDSQLVTPKPGKTNYDKNIDDKDGTYATMVHIPACSTPRVLTGSGDGRSEGYIVHVYENYVVFEGYEFVKGETFAYATYIIDK